MLAAADTYVKNTVSGKRARAARGGEILDPNDYLLMPGWATPQTRSAGSTTHTSPMHFRHRGQADAFLTAATAAITAGRRRRQALPKLIGAIQTAAARRLPRHERLQIGLWLTPPSLGCAIGLPCTSPAALALRDPDTLGNALAM
jgi:hypothetical protein